MTPEAIEQSKRRQIRRLNQILLLLSAGRPIPRKQYWYIAGWLRFAVDELNKAPTKPKRANHRPRSWDAVTARFMFGRKVVHEKNTHTRAYGEIIETFGLKDEKTISEHPEFIARKEATLEEFRRAHFHPRKNKK